MWSEDAKAAMEEQAKREEEVRKKFRTIDEIKAELGDAMTQVKTDVQVDLNIILVRGLQFCHFRPPVNILATYPIFFPHPRNLYNIDIIPRFSVYVKDFRDLTAKNHPRKNFYGYFRQNFAEILRKYTCSLSVYS